MNRQMVEAAEGAIASYDKILGRRITDDDPVFLEALLYSEEQAIQESSEVFKYAFGTSDEELYAFRKLRFFVSKKNRKQTTLKDVRAWDNARKEYRAIVSGRKKVSPNPLLVYQAELENWGARLIYLYALLLHKTRESGDIEIDLSETISVPSYILFCLTKHTKTLKASSALMANHFNEDAFSLIRTIYENYLQISTALFNPVQLQAELTAKVGLQSGTHVLDKDCIVESATGRHTKPLNNRQRAALDTEFNHENSVLYRTLYEYLPYFVHPDLRIAGYYFKDGYFSHNSDSRQFVVFFYINLVNAMLLYDLLKLEFFTGQNQQDIKFFTQEITALLLKILSVSKEKGVPEIESRLKKMARSKVLK